MWLGEEEVTTLLCTRLEMDDGLQQHVVVEWSGVEVGSLLRVHFTVIFPPAR